jgi:opacity protein-like surface antigen
MKLLSMIAVAATMAFAAPLQAQLFYVGIRGGTAMPRGEFENEEFENADQFIAGAKRSLGYGLDAGVNLGPLGFYGGYDKINFDCNPGTCASDDSNYKLEGVSAGVRLSVPLIPIIKPWVKAGVTLAELESDYGPTSSKTNFKSDRTPGYELGAGVDIPFGGIFSFTPQVRYVRQKFDIELGSGTKVTNDADYYTFDLGLRLRSPI